jgi:acetyl-CoA acetyltransferase
LITGQEGIRGQVVLKDCGFSSIPIVNVENACSSGSTAFRGAWLEVASGLHDVALALGVEKMYCENTAKTIKAIAADTDVEVTSSTGVQFTALYAMQLKRFMAKMGVTLEHVAKVVVKNRHNGFLNSYAQFQKEVTVKEVLNSRLIADPLTLMMCAPIGDGAAAAILCAKEKAREYTDKPLIDILACSLRSGVFRQGYFAESSDEIDSVKLAANDAYRDAGLGPHDIDFAEVHDAMAPAELWLTEKLGLVKGSDIIKMVEEGWNEIDGCLPINTSGGLVSKGHPIGATGVAQICELVWQLRGEAEKRQLEKPLIGLAENGGGRIDGDNAARVVTILKRSDPW